MLRQINMSYTKALEKPKFQKLVSTLNVARGEEIPFKKAWDTHQELDEETTKRYQKETNIVIKNLAAQNKGAGLAAELNRCDKVLNQNAANAVNNAEQAKMQAKQELESNGFVVM